MKMKWFKESEFNEFSKMQPELLSRLDNARDLAGIPFYITSSYRSPDYNSLHGGVRNSAHTRGFAVDVRCLDNEDRWKIVHAAFCAGFPPPALFKALPPFSIAFCPALVLAAKSTALPPSAPP